MGGSSPRWRGKLGLRRHVQEHGRLIPALAGKTTRHGSRPARTSAHPRAGGENHTMRVPDALADGSSPRWRGKLDEQRLERAAERLIPALAGKTNTPSDALIVTSAHPRAGGENVQGRSAEWVQRGSSPRWRGKLAPRAQAVAPIGLIPALAGKTPGSPRRWRRTGAHPRAGGENHENVGLEKTVGGSSPRWRGKLRAQDRSAHHLGLIPALAGKTREAAARTCWWWAHPRAGGENSAVFHALKADFGSSPRWRGKLRVHGLRLARARLIPALAGKTLSDLRFYRADRSDLGNP